MLVFSFVLLVVVVVLSGAAFAMYSLNKDVDKAER